MIGSRVRQARRAAGMSLRDLAEKAGVSAMAISKYEREVIGPSASSIVKLARALSVKTEFFFRPARVSIKETCFRKLSAAPRREMDQVRYTVQEALERIQELERTMGKTRISPFKIPPGFKNEAMILSDVERRAEELREDWSLGLDPIESVAETLEDHGVKVIILEMPERIDGFSCMAQGSWVGASEVPVIVSRRGVCGDRQRFNMIHELGHLTLRIGDNVNPEKACHRFASAFLVPGEAAIKELGHRRAALSFDELRILKRKYGMSIAAWIYRAKDLEIISGNTAQNLYKNISQMGWRKLEPDPIEPEEAQRFMLLVHQASAEGLISGIHAQELLKAAREVCTMSFNEELLEEAAALVAHEYAEGGELSDFSEVFEEDFSDE